MRLKTEEIKNMRMSLGKYLHSYYVKFGEKKYDEFIEKIGPSMEREYGEPFSKENLRIMEAEYVTFNKTFNNKGNNFKNNTK